MAGKSRSIGVWRNIVTAAALALLGLGASSTKAHAKEPIVGLWQEIWTDSSNAVIANVWDVWHDDQTETQNDSGPVIAGFVCQGAWKSVGERTYGLNHPSFNYLPPDGHLDTSSVALILEKVTVSKDGNTLAGTGIVKVLSGLDPYDPSATVLFTQNFNISAKRVTVDTSQLP